MNLWPTVVAAEIWRKKVITPFLQYPWAIINFFRTSWCMWQNKIRPQKAKQRSSYDTRICKEKGGQWWLLFKKWDQPKLILHVQPAWEIYLTRDIQLLLFINSLPTALKKASTMLRIHRSCQLSNSSTLVIAQGILDSAHCKPAWKCTTL